MKSKFLPAIILFMLVGRILYAAAPAITSFSPASGPVGTLVTITGTNLGTPTTFSIGGKTAIVVSNNGTQLVGLVMPGALTGPVTVATSGGTTSGTGNFAITARPAVNMVQNGYVLEGSGLSTSQGYSVAISADGKTAVIGGVSGNNGGHYNAEIAYVFTYASDTWTLQAGLQGVGSTPDQGSSSAVAISADGNTILLGAQYDGTGAGGSGFVYAFTRTGTTWTQQGGALIGTGSPGNIAHQGVAVALSADGNTAAIGGWYDSSLVGATWIFTRTGSTWTQQGNKLVGTGYAGQSVQGSTVALSADGNTLIEGGEFDNNYEGAAWVFARSGGVWTQQGNKLVGNDVVIGSSSVQQGHGVAISADGNTAIVGGPGDNIAGAAWIYTRTGSAWTQQGSKLVGTGTSTVYKYAREGNAVALSADGNLALIGGNGDYTTIGALGIVGSTWEFSRSGANWAQIGNKLVGEAGTTTDDQGFSVALSADGITALVGADERQNGQGAAYVFTTIAPSAVTQGASLITATTATISGTVDENIAATNAQPANYNLAATTVTMVYGTSPTLTTKTTATLTTGTSPMPGGAAATTFTSALTGLAPLTTYYYMISGINSFGTANGGIKSFTTGVGAIQPQTITFAAPASEVYGSPDFNPGATSTNTTIPITYASSNTAVATIVNNQVHIIGAGNTQITASQAGNAGYSAATPVTVAFVVTQAPLTITAADQTRVYNTPNLPLTVTYAGFVNGDTQKSLTSPATATTTATAASAPGSYPITASGAADPNYAITYKAGSLVINAGAPIATTIAASNYTYSGATLNGTINDDGAATTVQFQYSTSPNLSGAITVPVATGISPVPAGGGTTTFTGVLTGLTASTTYYFRINGVNSAGTTFGSILSFSTSPPAVVTLTFSSPGYVYYGSLTTPAISSTDPNSPIMYRFVTPGVAQVSNGKFQAIGVGSSTIVAYQYAPGTTNIEAVADGSITVIPAPLNIAADNKTIVWGQPAPAFTATYTGFVNGDTPANLPAAVLPDLRTPYLTGNSAGAYYIFNGPTGTSIQANYNITYTNGTLTVSQLYPKPIATTVAATDINSTGATIKGIVSTNQGPATTVTLQYTDDDDDGLQGLITATLTTGSNPLAAGSGSTNYSAVLTGLKPNTTYYFIINGINPEFTTTGNVMTFTTPGPISTPTIAFAPLAPVVYGSADVAPGATVTNSDIAISYTSSNTAVATIVNNKIHVIGVGTSQITASLSGTAATPVTQPFTVTQAPLLITADNKTMVAGTAVPQLTITYTGFVYNETQSSLTTTAAAATIATVNSAAGPYPITVSGATDPNYAITYKTGILTITPALPPPTTLTFTLPSYISYGATAASTVTSTDKTGTFTYTSGNPAILQVSGDGQVKAVGIGYTYVTVTQTAAGGSTPEATAKAYTTATQAGLTISADNKTITIGSQLPVLTITYTGFVNNDTQANLTTPATATTTATAASAPGGYPITVSGATDPDYIISYTPGTLTITGSPLTFNPIPPKIYGNADFDPGAAGTNIFYSSSDTSTAIIVSGLIHIKNAGTSIITASNSSGTLQQTLTVNKASLSITANAQTKIYGAAIPALTLSYSGFVYNDGPSKLTTPATATTTATSNSSTGSYPITVSGAASRDYSIIYNGNTLTITPAALTIAADNKTITTGSPIPQLTATYTGFVNNDTQASLTSAATATTTATISSPIGSYPITVSGAADANYTITYKPGVLTINGPLTFNPIASKTYGNPDFDPGAIGTAITYTSSNTGVATIVEGKIHIVSAGTSTITVHSGNNSIPQTLTVNKAALTITANNQVKAYNTANPALTLSYTGFVNNEDQSVLTTQATATTTATTTSAIGTYPITVSGAAAANYTITYQAGTLTVTIGTQSITFNPIPTKMYAAPDFDPGATASSGAAIIYSSSNTGVATIVDNQVHIISVGTASISATVAPNSNYSNTPTATQLLTVTQATQTITFSAIPTQERKTTYDLSGVIASSGLPVSFTVSDMTVATISGTTLSSNELGTVTVTASQPGNANYLAAPSVAQTYTVTDPNNDLVLVRFVVSPNGDGINDVLVVEGIENYPDNKMILINRNGVKVYEASGYNNGSRVFDGHSSITGALQQAGTLLYVLEYRVNGQMKRKTGFTELRY